MRTIPDSDAIRANPASLLTDWQYIAHTYEHLSGSLCMLDSSTSVNLGMYAVVQFVLLYAACILLVTSWSVQFWLEKIQFTAHALPIDSLGTVPCLIALVGLLFSLLAV